MAGHDGDIDARSELEARVYSRSGLDEPRVERYDHESGRVLELTESEWRLLEIERAGGASGAASARTAQSTTATGTTATDAPLAAAEAFEPPEPPEPASTDGGPPRQRMAPFRAGAIGFVVATGLFAAWLGLSEAVSRTPALEISIVPTPVADDGAAAPVAVEDAGSPLPSGQALDFFRDPRKGDGVLPGWLNAIFERSHVAEIIGPDGPVPGATVYAAISNDEIACLIVGLKSNGMVWNCTSLERVLEGGMTMNAVIPRGVGTRTDQDGDGVMGQASETDVLTVEWRPDGTFVVTRHDP